MMPFVPRVYIHICIQECGNSLTTVSKIIIENICHQMQNATENWLNDSKCEFSFPNIINNKSIKAITNYVA